MCQRKFKNFGIYFTRSRKSSIRYETHSFHTFLNTSICFFLWKWLSIDFSIVRHLLYSNCVLFWFISHELDVEAAENLLFKKESGIMEISSIAEVRKIFKRFLRMNVFLLRTQTKSCVKIKIKIVFNDNSNERLLNLNLNTIFLESCL